MSDDEAVFVRTMAERLLHAAMSCADPFTRDEVVTCANACLDRIGRNSANGGARGMVRTPDADLGRTN